MSILGAMGKRRAKRRRFKASVAAIARPKKVRPKAQKSSKKDSQNLRELSEAIFPSWGGEVYNTALEAPRGMSPTDRVKWAGSQLGLEKEDMAESYR